MLNTDTSLQADDDEESGPSSGGSSKKAKGSFRVHGLGFKAWVLGGFGFKAFGAKGLGLGVQG